VTVEVIQIEKKSNLSGDWIYASGL
jgi:hypothetical protein